MRNGIKLNQEQVEIAARALNDYWYDRSKTKRGKLVPWDRLPEPNKMILRDWVFEVARTFRHGETFEDFLRWMRDPMRRCDEQV